MALEPIGDIADVSFGAATQTEILAWSTEADWNDAVDRPGMVADGIGDHPGATKAADGYDYGSLTRGLVLYYGLDEGSGSTAGDATELGNDGTINGATWLGSGKIGGDALSFDGTDDYIGCGYNDTYQVTEFTLAGWVYINSHTGNGDAIFDRWGNFMLRAGPWGSSAPRQLETGFTGKDGNDYTLTGNTDITTGTWFHAAATFDGSNLNLYYDGSPDGSTSPSSTPQTTTNTLTMASRDGGSYLVDGRLDDLRIYDRALSTPEISALASLTSPSSVNAGDTLQ